MLVVVEWCVKNEADEKANILVFFFVRWVGVETEKDLNGNNA